MNDEERWERNQFEELIQGLMDQQYGCCNDFIIPSVIAELRNNLTMLNTAGNLKSAGIGAKKDFQNNPLIRNDKVHWIEEYSTNPYEKIYLEKIWRFIHYLNKTCFTSIKSFESHYANFGIGSFYKKHLDQFKTEKGRKFSIVLYLNENWEEKDAGYLALYPQNAAPQNIAPIGGRLVFFRSDEMEHEVLPSTTRDRKSIAGWLKN